MYLFYNFYYNPFLPLIIQNYKDLKGLKSPRAPGILCLFGL